MTLALQDQCAMVLRLARSQQAIAAIMTVPFAEQRIEVLIGPPFALYNQESALTLYSMWEQFRLT